jgi:phosphotransferase system  glucose/maltose/N-acetylglucosamine-specific IIC component
MVKNEENEVHETNIKENIFQMVFKKIPRFSVNHLIYYIYIIIGLLILMIIIFILRFLITTYLINKPKNKLEK